MWALLLIAALQVGPRINGKVVVDYGNIPLITVRIKPEGKSSTAQVWEGQAFSNGTFHVDGVCCADEFWVEVVQPGFRIVNFKISIREQEDYNKELVIRLVHSDSTSTAYSSFDAPPPKILDKLKVDPKIPSVAQEELRRGLALLLAPKPDPNDTAESHFRKAVELAPDFYEAHLQLAIDLARRHRLDDAMTSAERAMALKPDAPAPLSLRGRLYVESGRYEEGLETLRKVPPLANWSADDRYYVGLAFYRLGKMDGAEQQFEMSISMAPDANPGPYVYLGDVFLKTGNPEAGLKWLERYLKLFPNDLNHKKIEALVKQLRQ